MKNYSQTGKLTGDVMEEIMHEEKEPSLEKVILPGKIRKFFPRSYTLEQIEQVIISLLESWYDLPKDMTYSLQIYKYLLSIPTKKKCPPSSPPALTVGRR